MEKFEPLKKIKNIKIHSPKLEDLDYILNQRIREPVRIIPTPILVLFLDCSRVDPKDINEHLVRVADSLHYLEKDHGWIVLILPIFSGQDSRIEVATVADVPQNFEEFKEELLKRIKEIHGSS